MPIKAKLVRKDRGWQVESEYGVIFLPEFESMHLDQAVQWKLHKDKE